MYEAEEGGLLVISYQTSTLGDNTGGKVGRGIWRRSNRALCRRRGL